MEVTAHHHIGIAVLGIARSKRFYQEALGFEVRLEREITTTWVATANALTETQIILCFLEGHGMRIELLQFIPSSGAMPADGANRPGRVHLTFLVDDIQHIVARLDAMGVPFNSAPVTNTEGPNKGAQIVFLTDPDGVWIELIQPPPGKKQSP